jgi:hypothetical protein
LVAFFFVALRFAALRLAAFFRVAFFRAAIAWVTPLVGQRSRTAVPMLGRAICPVIDSVLIDAR